MKRNVRLIGKCLILGLSSLTLSCHKDKAKPTVMAPVRVTVLEVTEGSSSSDREYSGTVSSSENTTLSFSVAGRVTALNVSEGDKVHKGQTLGRIDDGDYLNAKNIAYAQLAEAQDGYARLKKLHDANALPDVKWVEMEQKLKQAQNAAEMADRTLRDAVMVSPVSGTVSQKFVDVGQSVVPVQPVYEIVSTNNLEVNVPVSENEISNFTIGQKATIKFDSKGVENVEGKIKSKSIVADPLTRSFDVKVSLPESAGKILPGMIANVSFERSETNTTSSGIVLPNGSVLLDHDNKWFVWVVDDSIARRKFVEVNELVDNGVLVTSGLNSGDMVIVEGMQKVGTGSKVIPLIK